MCESACWVPWRYALDLPPNLKCSRVLSEAVCLSRLYGLWCRVSRGFLLRRISTLVFDNMDSFHPRQLSSIFESLALLRFLTLENAEELLARLTPAVTRLPTKHIMNILNGLVVLDFPRVEPVRTCVDAVTKDGVTALPRTHAIGVAHALLQFQIYGVKDMLCTEAGKMLMPVDLLCSPVPEDHTDRQSNHLYRYSVAAQKSRRLGCGFSFHQITGLQWATLIRVEKWCVRLPATFPAADFLFLHTQLKRQQASDLHILSPQPSASVRTTETRACQIDEWPSRICDDACLGWLNYGAARICFQRIGTRGSFVFLGSGGGCASCLGSFLHSCLVQTKTS